MRFFADFKDPEMLCYDLKLCVALLMPFFSSLLMGPCSAATRRTASPGHSAEMVLMEGDTRALHASPTRFLEQVEQVHLILACGSPP